MNPYFIYSHADADGGVAAAMLACHIKEHFPNFSPVVEPVHHGGAGVPDWSLRPIAFPCAILDFTIHPQLLDKRFTQQKKHLNTSSPPCVWADHHPTGSPYPLLKSENVYINLEGVQGVWDVDAISTPSLLRKHHNYFGISQGIIRKFEDLIDLADVVDGALFATPESAHDFSSPAVILQILFQGSHPIVNQSMLFKKLVSFLIHTPSFEALYDSDPLYAALVEFEQTQYFKQVALYKKHLKRVGVVSVAQFKHQADFPGVGRFVPYVLDPTCHFGLHITPLDPPYYSLSCGINPWNKTDLNGKHLGHFFSEVFGGGGHAFVAGAKIHEKDIGLIERLLNFLNT